MKCPGKCAHGFDRAGLCPAYQRDECPGPPVVIVIELPVDEAEKGSILATLWAQGIKYEEVPHIHLASGGADRDEKRYTKRDVEALAAIGIALERMRSKR